MSVLQVVQALRHQDVNIQFRSFDILTVNLSFAMEPFSCAVRFHDEEWTKQ